MYGKSPKMSGSKMPKKEGSKGMPLTIMIAVGKPKTRPMPERGGRTATNMMKKSGRGK
jgi:hypothetical protein